MKTVLIGLIVVLVILVIGSLGLVGWKVIGNNSDNKQSTSDSVYKGIKLKFTNQGPAMEPTIANGQEIYGYLAQPTSIKRGDIIVFKPLVAGTERMVKRVVGLPGDTVIVDGGKITVNTNDGSIYEPGLTGAPSMQKINKLVSENSFFVVGDNLSNSLDSRAEGFGLIPYDNLLSVIEL